MARSESERAESALADRSTPFRAERDRSQLGFQQVRDAVPPLSALVSFVRYERVRAELRPQAIGPAAQSGSAPRTITSYLAFIIRQHEPPVVVPLGAAATIDSLVARWRADLVGEALQATGQPGDASRSDRVSGTALRRRIWDPIADHLRDVGNAFIVPDGTLSLIPFAALPVGRVTYFSRVVRSFTICPPSEMWCRNRGSRARSDEVSWRWEDRHSTIGHCSFRKIWRRRSRRPLCEELHRWRQANRAVQISEPPRFQACRARFKRPETLPTCGTIRRPRAPKVGCFWLRATRTSGRSSSRRLGVGCCTSQPTASLSAGPACRPSRV